MFAFGKWHWFQFAVIEFHFLERTLIEFASGKTRFCIETSFYKLGVLKITVYENDVFCIARAKVNVGNHFILNGGIFEIFCVEQTAIVGVAQFYHRSQVWEHEFARAVVNRLIVFFSQRRLPLRSSRRNKCVTVVKYWSVFKLVFKRHDILFRHVGGVKHYIFAIGQIIDFKFIKCPVRNKWGLDTAIKSFDIPFLRRLSNPKIVVRVCRWLDRPLNQA